MWRPWAKSSPKRENPTPSIFRCSSFKDIENLCIDSDDFLSPSHHHHKRHPSTPRRSIFHRVHTATSLLRQWPGKPDPKSPPETLNRGLDARILLYYTSLRVVRSTFEACRSVRSILQGFRVAIDERDLAMDSGFMSELQQIMGRTRREKLTLPRVFIDGRYVGGVDEVKYLHEIGELKKLVEGLPPASPLTCGACGGYKFILCSECSGSHKIFSEKTGFRSCTSCNENGLIRCPLCCCPPLSRLISAY